MPMAFSFLSSKSKFCSSSRCLFYRFVGPRVMNNKYDALKSDDSGEEEMANKAATGTEEKSTVENHEVASSSSDDPSKQPIEVPAGHHRLQFAYAIWFTRRPGSKTTALSYNQHLKFVGTFATVEQFWSYYSFLVKPSDLSSYCDFHLFKDGIKPMWEDDANKEGGKWIVRLKKGLASRCWENLILAMLGEQFMVGEEICGAVISIRFQEDIICVWNKTASDQATTARIRDTLRRVLNLPANTIMEYKRHNVSLRDNSSFRNTDIFMR